MCLFHLVESIFFFSRCNIYVWNMCSSELIYLAISFVLQVTSIMPLHPQVSRGVFDELKGSSAGICLHLKPDCIFCAFVYDVLL